ncbi:MAG: SgcJ/EcaC family oxidoreductase [Gemmatimonadota bacterium]
MRTRTSLSSALVLVAAAAFISCQPPAEEAAVEETTPAVDLAAEADAVESISMRWAQAAQARDLDAVMAVFAEDAVTFPDGQAPAEGPAAIRAVMQEQWSAMPDATIDWATKSVEVSDAGDMAWERGTWTFDPDGVGESAPETGEYLTVYEKIDGEWKVVADIGTDTPAAATEEAM